MSESKISDIRILSGAEELNTSSKGWFFEVAEKLHEISLKKTLEILKEKNIPITQESFLIKYLEITK